MVVCVCHPSYRGKAQIGGQRSKLGPRHEARSCLKNNQCKRVGRVVYMLGDLHSRCETLSSTLSTTTPSPKKKWISNMSVGKVQICNSGLTRKLLESRELCLPVPHSFQYVEQCLDPRGAQQTFVD
jgi:hypothetical protein